MRLFRLVFLCFEVAYFKDPDEGYCPKEYTDIYYINVVYQRELTCEDFGTFSAGPDNQCGGDDQGGPEYKSFCCSSQKDYYRLACSFDLNPNASLMTCLYDRGCDFESTAFSSIPSSSPSSSPSASPTSIPSSSPSSKWHGE